VATAPLREIVVDGGYDLLTHRFLPELIWRSIDLHPVTGCWLWRGPKQSEYVGDRRRTAYGYIPWVQELAWIKRRGLCEPTLGSVLAHRFFFAWHHGRAIREGYTVDHCCKERHPLCCNPEHLEEVTRGLNSSRGNRDNRRPPWVVPPLFNDEAFCGTALCPEGPPVLFEPFEVPVSSGLPGGALPFRATRMGRGLEAAVGLDGWELAA
jgi:hypothetical protein